MGKSLTFMINEMSDVYVIVTFSSFIKIAADLHFDCFGGKLSDFEL